MVQISQLFIYPIKSLAGIGVNSALLTDRGLKQDRRWMLVDENNRFLTQREFGQMALLQPSFLENGMQVRHIHAGDNIFIPFQPETDEHFPALIWDDTCQVQHVSPAVSSWFSRQLGIDCKLVYMPDTTLRPVDQAYAPNGDTTHLGDGYPLLIIGQASLDDLNRRLAKPLEINRFRPNVVFTGGEPYQEDRMQHFRMAGIDFFGVKICARCPIPTIDPQTGERSKEPLKTLASYRRKNHKVFFGQNLLYHGKGMIAVGDQIELIKMAEAPLVFD